MRFISICAALLLLIGAGSCSGKALEDSGDRGASKAFTLSDAEISAFVNSPELSYKGDVAGPSDHINSVPAIFSDVASSDAPFGKTTSTANHGHRDGCDRCASGCGKCNHKSSCKCHGECKKCHSCKDGCGKCNHKNTCTCHGKCKQKCNHCQSGCKKCSHDGNCGCHKCDCPPPPCNCVVKCKSITNTTQRTFNSDCTTHTADVTYCAHVTYTDCPHRTDEAAGHTVDFYRNGVKVGSGTTDVNGDVTFTEHGVTTGSYSAKAVTECCSVCFSICIVENCCEVECEDIANTGDATFQADCATHCADVVYSVHITYNDCPDRTDEALGHEVVFKRNGAEVGRANTNATGDASFTEHCVDLGDYQINVTSQDCNLDFPVNVYEDCCQEICTGMTNDTERFFKADCFGTSAEAALRVHLDFSECPGRVFDKSGMDVTFSADGAEIGHGTTDADGEATFAWHNVALGNHHITAVSDECATEFDITAWEECKYHACISGKGKIPGLNATYGVLLYEAHVNAGMLEMVNTMSYADGAAETFSNVPVEWLIVNGAEVFFGNDDIMMHTIDNGPAPGADFFEIFDFSTGYHNSHLLLNGQIRSSFGIYKPGDPLKHDM